jgi:2-polyprenyl-3-methyl-5-hydroxy-6-metoxy-1,4-benzoquinol methylase
MAGRLDNPLHRGVHVCPWWLAYSFDNPLRRLLHPPERLFSGLIAPGETALDVGCGMGHFTLGLARMVGPAGKVIAVDLQPQMLERVRRRAERAGLSDRIRLLRAGPASLELSARVDFVVASWMVHEVSDRAHFLLELAGLMNPGGRLFVAEPRGHVPAEDVERTVALAQGAGLRVESRPRVPLSRAVIFAKPR